LADAADVNGVQENIVYGLVHAAATEGEQR